MSNKRRARRLFNKQQEKLRAENLGLSARITREARRRLRMLSDYFDLYEDEKITLIEHEYALYQEFAKFHPPSHPNFKRLFK